MSGIIKFFIVLVLVAAVAGGALLLGDPVREFKATYYGMKLMASMGDAEAQFRLGNYYRDGKGGVVDYPESVKWYRKSAEQGFIRAQMNIGYAYDAGEGVEKDRVESLRWYTMVADKGEVMSQLLLADSYFLGRGIPVDYPKAVAWYKKAATTGSPKAEDALGYAYRDGWGVEKDMVQACDWFGKAAAHSWIGAMYRLAQLYDSGDCGEVKKPEAIGWYKQAYERAKAVAATGDMDAENILGYLFADGKLFPADLQQSFFWHEKAAQAGKGDSQMRLGYAYFYGWGVPKNDSLAASWLRVAANNNVPEASGVLFQQVLLQITHP